MISLGPLPMPLVILLLALATAALVGRWAARQPDGTRARGHVDRHAQKLSLINIYEPTSP